LDLTNKMLHLMNNENLHLTILGEARHEIPHQYLISKKSANFELESGIYLERRLAKTIEWYRNFLQNEN